MITLDKAPTADTFEPGGHFVTVTDSIGGFFAVEMWLNNEIPHLGLFFEPWDKLSIMSHGNVARAIEDAEIWALDLGLPLYIPEAYRG